MSQMWCYLRLTPKSILMCLVIKTAIIFAATFGQTSLPLKATPPLRLQSDIRVLLESSFVYPILDVNLDLADTPSPMKWHHLFTDTAKGLTPASLFFYTGFGGAEWTLRQVHVAWQFQTFPLMLLSSKTIKSFRVNKHDPAVRWPVLKQKRSLYFPHLNLPPLLLFSVTQFEISNFDKGHQNCLFDVSPKILMP